MAWPHCPSRHMLVAAALLVLCVVDASLVHAAATPGTTDEERAHTLKFLQGFVTLNPSLASIWTGTDFCRWRFVSCGSSAYVLDFLDGVEPLFTGSLVLPELADDVDGSLVPLSMIRVNGMDERVTGTLPASWGRLTRLSMLHLDGNALTGSLPAAWSTLTSLNTLSLQDNRLEGPLPSTWGALTKINYIYLFNNKLSGSLPAEWGAMTSLSMLYLQINQLTGSLPAGWRTMTQVSEVNLDDNALTGSLPAEWNSLASLMYLHLQNNQLSGSLPAEWGAMQWFSFLDLGNNSLTGSLPAAWGTMLQLSSLSLQNNALTGSLPAEWKGMSSLSMLQLSNNHLVGSIPEQWGSLQLFTVDLRGNGLCGCLPKEWKKGTLEVSEIVDPAVSAPNCSTVNTCKIASRKSGPNLIPLWCVLGVLGGALVGLAAGLGVYFHRRRQHKEAEVKRSQASEGVQEEPFAQTPDSPY